MFLSIRSSNRSADVELSVDEWVEKVPTSEAPTRESNPGSTSGQRFDEKIEGEEWSGVESVDGLLPGEHISCAFVAETEVKRRQTIIQLRRASAMPPPADFKIAEECDSDEEVEDVEAAPAKEDDSNS